MDDSFLAEYKICPFCNSIISYIINEKEIPFQNNRLLDFCDTCQKDIKAEHSNNVHVLTGTGCIKCEMLIYFYDRVLYPGEIITVDGAFPASEEIYFPVLHGRIICPYCEHTTLKIIEVENKLSFKFVKKYIKYWIINNI